MRHANDYIATHIFSLLRRLFPHGLLPDYRLYHCIHGTHVHATCATSTIPHEPLNERPAIHATGMKAQYSMYSVPVCVFVGTVPVSPLPNKDTSSAKQFCPY